MIWCWWVLSMYCMYSSLKAFFGFVLIQFVTVFVCAFLPLVLLLLLLSEWKKKLEVVTHCVIDFVSTFLHPPPSSSFLHTFPFFFLSIFFLFSLSLSFPCPSVWDVSLCPFPSSSCFQSYTHINTFFSFWWNSLFTYIVFVMYPCTYNKSMLLFLIYLIHVQHIVWFLLSFCL